MDALALLQKLYRQFPRENEPLSSFSRIEKELRAGFGLQKALFLVKGDGGMRAGEKGALVLPQKDPLLRRLERARKPLVLSKAGQGKWSGFWPVTAGNSWAACYALGRKKNGKGLDGAEKKLMELLADRTALFFEERRLWELLERADSLSSLGFLSAVMVHEIRNPLTALNTFIQLLPRKKDDEKFMDTFQKTMTKEISRLAGLTETYLGLFEPDHGKRGRVDLSAVIQRVTRLFHPLFDLKKVRLRVKAGPCAYLRGEDASIESLLMNLLKNALESTERDGIVEISAALRGKRVRLVVRDTGKGITKENMRRIFDPYFSTKGEGAGLGLALCRRVVEDHHGRIKVASPLGKGAVFTVDLPGSPGI